LRKRALLPVDRLGHSKHKDDDVKKLIAGALVASAVLAAPTPTDATVPSWQDRADAKRFARAYWADEYGAYTYCSGVRMRCATTTRTATFAATSPIRAAAR
jgi:hypothetical protein